MSDASTTQSVECPICGDEFDPTVAGGWCTNTECGEWQYTEESTEAGTTDAAGESDDDLVSPEADEADEDTESVDLFEASDDEADDGGVDDVALATDEDDGGVDDVGVEAEGADGVAATTDDAADETVEGEFEEGDDGDDTTDAAESDGVEGADAGDVADTTEATESDAVADDAAEAVEAEDADETVEAEDAAEAADGDDVAEAVDADETVDDSAEKATDEADTIDCPDCGAELDAEANFCAECGSDVSNVSPGDADELDACPGCGTDVEPEDNFCVNCGEDLDAHRGGDADEHDDAIDALEATSDDGPVAVPDSLVLEIEGREIHVDDGDTVGREIRAALTEAGRPDDEAVRIHREHVRFVREGESFYLLDLGDNPTQLNGKTLQKGDREPVAPGDEIELSGVASVTVGAP
ncbi:double zinc ribbon domain-containing protein [Haloarcula laminariae]|uniref:double zinc ribbon domain-containing protein n=1 Tax=Haloarcula laminariae TaxID=2961577 RepID=UPI0021C6F526|nr:zinc ribbon domain-containing protein [Halomicroarcula laminariae]